MERLVQKMHLCIAIGLLSLLLTDDGKAAERAHGLRTVPSGVLVECEDFGISGKWKIDSRQYPGFSAKACLTETAGAAIERFTPSKTVRLPKAGVYYVWLRAYQGGPRDEGMHDRELFLQVNETVFEPTHRGLEGDGFRWELCGAAVIGEDGAAEIRIHDLGRRAAVADCVLLTDDAQFKPADWTGNSRRPALTLPFEVPDVAPVEAKPVQLAPAPREHVEEVTSSEFQYQLTMGGTLDEFNTACYPETYGMCTRLDNKFQPNEYLVIENVGPTDVFDPRIVVNGRRNWWSADDILATLFKPGMSDAEKAIAIWAFTGSNDVQCHENNRRVGPYYPDHRSHPSRNTFQERANPVKAANCYYCSGCQLGAANCVALLRHAGIPARAVWMCPRDQYEIHCVAEAWYDGGWHLFDPERRSFYLDSDNTAVASYETLHKNPALAARTHDGGFAARPGKLTHAENYERFYPPPVMPVEPWTSTMAMTLRPGEKFVWRWDHAGKFRLGQNPRNRNFEPYRLANGKMIYQPDLTAPGFRNGILSERNLTAAFEDGRSPAVHPQVPGETAFVSYRLKTPYPIVGGVVGGKFRRRTEDDTCKIYLSVGDSDWTEIWSADETGDFERYLAVDALLDVKLEPPRYECCVKYEFSAGQSVADAGLEGVYLEFDVQMASTSLPSLSVGTNEVVFRSASTGPQAVRITHGWKESSATRPPHAPAAAIAPTDRAEIGDGALRKLAWQAAEDPEGQPIADYHIQVSPREDMLHPISPNFDRLTFSAAPAWEVPQGWFVPGRKYYWRVRARDPWGAWSGWSPVWRFTIRPDVAKR